MNEYNIFNTLNIKNICRACLVIAENVSPMTDKEIMAYKKFINQMPPTEYDFSICTVCRWKLRKFVKFTEQCQTANKILIDSKMDSKLYIHIQKLTFSHNFKITKLDNHYMGPDSDMIDDDKYDMMDDHHIDDDDDEIPLVMLKDDCKKKKRKKSKNDTKTLELEDKQDESAKQEKGLELEESCKNKGRNKKNKEIKEGFSSRMVQETDEYIVIKLTKEQVLQEMCDRSKSDTYIRAPYKCDKCVKGFNFEDVLRTHMEKHRLEHGSYKCDMCSQYCPNPVSLRGHIKSHTTRYKCKLCGQVRLSRQHLLEHHAITHTNAATAYSCDQCHFITNKRTVIQRHVKSHAASERHSCHRCGKLFKSVESLRVHTIRHDKSSRVRCDSCDKQFIYPSLLHKHVAAVHERDDYYCVECDVKFKSPESLRLHFKKAKRHRDSSSYKHQCPQCEQRFISPSSLSVHLECARGLGKQFSCGNCNRQYSSRAAVRAHAWRTHAHTHRKNVLKIQQHNQTCDKMDGCARPDSGNQPIKNLQKREIPLPNGLEITQDDKNLLLNN